MATMTREPKKVKASKADTFSLCLAINHVCYGVEAIPPGEDNVRAFRLVKQSARECIYDVAQGRDGINRCDCPDYEARHAGTVSQCKHLRAAVAMGLIDAPTWTAPAVEAPPAAFVEAVREAIGPAEDLGPDGPVSLDAYLAATSEAPACEPSEGFADELAEAVGPLPIVDEPDPLADLPWSRPARVAPAPASPGLVPIRPALPPDGRYTLVGLVEAQAAFLRGQGSAPFALMAKALDDLAASIRATGATSVADYEDRLAVMEAERDGALMEAGYEMGRHEAEANAPGAVIAW